jgi:hypothetical protein
VFKLSACLLLSFISFGQKTEKEIRSYFEKNSSLDRIEGVWSVAITQEFYHFDTLYDVKTLPGTQNVAVLRENITFVAYYLKGEPYNLEFTTTDVNGVYMYRNFYPLISDYSKKQAVICTHGKMQYTYDLPEEYVVKICGDKYIPNTRIVNVMKWEKVMPAEK